MDITADDIRALNNKVAISDELLTSLLLDIGDKIRSAELMQGNNYLTLTVVIHGR